MAFHQVLFLYFYGYFILYWTASRGLLGPTTCLVPSLEFGYSLALVMRIRIGVGSLGVSGYTRVRQLLTKRMYVLT